MNSLSVNQISTYIPPISPPTAFINLHVSARVEGCAYVYFQVQLPKNQSSEIGASQKYYLRHQVDTGHQVKIMKTFLIVSR